LTKCAGDRERLPALKKEDAEMNGTQTGLELGQLLITPAAREALSPAT